MKLEDGASKVNKPDRKGQLLYDSIYMDTYSSQIHRMEIKAAITMSWEEGERGIYYLMSTEFQFGITKIFWRWIVIMVAQ